MITLQELTLQRGQKVLFDKVSLSIFAKQRVGLVGINGSGKTSFFAMLLGILVADAGSLFLQSNLRIAHLSQQIPSSEISATAYVLKGDQELTKLHDQLQKAENAHDHESVSEIHAKLYDIDGYAAQSRAKKLLTGLGFEKDELEKPVNEFSGGWRMRLNLAQVLMSRADLLLLDEPTNHLDLEAIIWLERWLKKYDGTFLLISHDREFLDNVVGKIISIQHCKLELYSGNYSSFEKQRAEKLLLEQAIFEKQQTQLKHVTKFIERFRYKASKSKQVQSRVKALDKMEKVAITQLDSPFSFEFLESKRAGAPLLHFEKMSFGYPDKKIFDRADFNLNPGDRVGLLGANGAGKSTLMKLLGGLLQIDEGEYHASKALRFGYYAQHQLDQLHRQKSAFEHIAEFDLSIREQAIRDFLGGFNFRGDRVFEPIDNFSGGEKARLVLAMLVWQKPNLLLLDEPTNHLDLDMREALTYALQSYDGALVIVSHDRHLLRTAVDEFYLVGDEKIKQFDGSVDDYQHWLSEKKEKEEAILDSEKKIVTISKGKIRKINVEKRLAVIDQKLSKLYAEKKVFEIDLAHHDLYQEKKKKLLEEKLIALKNLDANIEKLEAEWHELVEAE